MSLNVCGHLEAKEDLGYVFLEGTLLYKTRHSRLLCIVTSMVTRGTGMPRNSISRKKKVSLLFFVNDLDNSSSDGYR